MHFLGCLATISAVVRYILAQDFTFNYTSPQECGDLYIYWSGGVSPYVLTLFKGTARNFPFDGDGKTSGTINVQVPIKSGERMMILLSDATGFATGGTSDWITVGNRPIGHECNATDPRSEYYFSLDSDLVQCQPYPITLYQGAIQPITVYAMIPLGRSFVISPPISSTFSYNWTANVPAGTTIVFSMVDARARLGGSGSPRVVGVSNDTSCLPPALAPMPTPRPTSRPTLSPTSPTLSPTIDPRPTSSPVSRPTSPATITNARKAGLSTGSIIGVATSGVALIIVVALAIFFYRKRKGSPPARRRHSLDLVNDQGYLPPGWYNAVPPTPSSPLNPSPSSPQDRRPSVTGNNPPVAYTISPSQPPNPSATGRSTVKAHTLPPPPSPAKLHSYGPQDVPLSRPAGMVSSTMGSSSQVTGRRGSHPQPPRVIAHSDVNVDDGFVEPPPQYFEQGLRNQDLASSSISSNANQALLPHQLSDFPNKRP